MVRRRAPNGSKTPSIPPARSAHSRKYRDVRRQTLARLATTAGVAAARRQVLRQAPDLLAIDDPLARAVRRQRLGAEHRQHFHVWEQSLAALWRERSRKIERATYDSLAFRFIACNRHPNHDTVATFQRRFRKEFEATFVQVRQVAKSLAASPPRHRHRVHRGELFSTARGPQRTDRYERQIGPPGGLAAPAVGGCRTGCRSP